VAHHSSREGQRRQALDLDRRTRRRVRARRRATALAIAAAVCVLGRAGAGAQSSAPTVVRGTLTAIQVDRPDDRDSGGSVVVGKQRILIPPGLPVQLPGGPLTFTELWTLAPARCVERRESGLVPGDTCRRPPRDDRGGTPAWTLERDRTPRSYLDPEPTDEAPPTMARVTAVRGAGGALTASGLALTRTDTSVWGAVTFVNEQEGYLRVNGALAADEGGALLRINDPDARQSVQQGTGCGAQGNCSPDVRFKANMLTPTVRFEAGYTACIPGGLGTVCVAGSRPVRGLLDGNAMLPILVGDHITAQGGFEVHDGVRVFWAHTLTVTTSPMPEP
jgi:hypothetical protein